MILEEALDRLREAAEGRRVARKALIEAVADLADTIVKQGQAGDEVRVAPNQVPLNAPSVYRIINLYAEGSQGHNWPVRIDPDAQKALVIGDLILSNMDGGWSDGSNWHNPTGRYFEDDSREEEYGHAAARECVTFAEVAGEVLAGFTKLYAAEAKDFDYAVDTLKKVTA